MNAVVVTVVVLVVVIGDGSPASDLLLSCGDLVPKGGTRSVAELFAGVVECGGMMRVRRSLLDVEPEDPALLCGKCWLVELLWDDDAELPDLGLSFGELFAGFRRLVFGVKARPGVLGSFAAGGAITDRSVGILEEETVSQFPVWEAVCGTGCTSFCIEAGSAVGWGRLLPIISFTSVESPPKDDLLEEGINFCHIPESPLSSLSDEAPSSEKEAELM